MDNPWELYETDTRWPRATKEIEKAWEEAKRLAPEKSSAERARLAEQHVFKTLKKWADLGALDSEPMRVLNGRIRRHFNLDYNW